jgi:peptidoglycan/LPS O-acetylase OafA/YrhL
MPELQANPAGGAALDGRIPELDGIRGLAIALVLVWHYLVNTVQTAPGSLTAYLLKGLGLTWSGVDLFFVLSGFLIGDILLDARDSPRYFRTFYLRRSCRIFPLYFVVVAIFLSLLHFADSSALRWEWLLDGAVPAASYMTFTQNFAMAGTRDFGAAFLNVTWSLAIEEQFYLLLPLLIRYAPHRRLVPALIALIAIAPAFRSLLYVLDEPLAAYVLLPSRWDALLMGVLVACILRSAECRAFLGENSRWFRIAFLVGAAGMAVLILGKASTQSLPMMSMGYTWIAAFYAMLLLLVLMRPGLRVFRPLRWTWLRALGAVSFGIYLLHQGVLGIVHGQMFRRAPLVDDIPTGLATLAALIFTIGICTVSWRYLERPIIRLGRRAAY